MCVCLLLPGPACYCPQELLDPCASACYCLTLPATACYSPRSYWTRERLDKELDILERVGNYWAGEAMGGGGMELAEGLRS